MIRAVIKGSRKRAIGAARKRGLTPRNCQRHPRKKFNETFCDFPCSQELKLMKWYGEPGQAPFKPGALLFYSQCGRKRGRK